MDIFIDDGSIKTNLNLFEKELFMMRSWVACLGNITEQAKEGIIMENSTIKNVSEYLQYFVPIYNMNKSEFKEWAVSSIPNTSITYDDNKNIVEIDVN